MKNNNLIGSWVRRFLLEYLVSERNLSINTKNSYRDMLVLLLPYASKQLKKPTDCLTINDLSPDLIRKFLIYLEVKRNCCISTRNQRLSALHALAKFIGENSPEHIEWCTQVRLIPFKKTGQQTLSYLEKPEMDALLASPDQSIPLEHRDYTMLLFLYNSGARVSEAARLKISDIDWHAQFVKILGKGNKQRICPLWPITMEQLSLITVNRGPDQHIFLNRNGRHITRFGIHTLVERHAIRAAKQMPSIANKRVTPHVIRHYGVRYKMVSDDSKSTKSVS